MQGRSWVGAVSSFVVVDDVHIDLRLVKVVTKRAGKMQH